MKNIKLTDKQFNIIVQNAQQINAYKEKLAELEANQNNLISLICEFNKVEKYESLELNVENKELIIN